MWRARMTVMCVVVFLVSCAEAEGDGSTLEGVVVAAAEKGEVGNRWVVTVALDDVQIAGSGTVQVAFDQTAVTCDDGTALTPDAIRVGADLGFTRVGSDAEMMSPPIVGGDTLVVAC